MKYLDVTYNKKEFGKEDYPQRLCSYIYDNYFQKKGKLLDIGCGRGTHSKGFKRCGLKVSGIDKLNEAAANKTCDLEKDKIPYRDNYFDFVFTKSVIEHIHNTDNFLEEIYRVLKPSGKAVIITPDWASCYKYFYIDYTHVKPFNRKNLQDAMLLKDFKDVKVTQFIQLPFVWKYPWLKIVPDLVNLLPDSWTYKDKEETIHRTLIRFSKQRTILGVGTKNDKP